MTDQRWDEMEEEQTQGKVQEDASTLTDGNNQLILNPSSPLIGYLPLTPFKVTGFELEEVMGKTFSFKIKLDRNTDECFTVKMNHVRSVLHTHK